MGSAATGRGFHGLLIGGRVSPTQWRLAVEWEVVLVAEPRGMDRPCQ